MSGHEKWHGRIFSMLTVAVIAIGGSGYIWVMPVFTYDRYLADDKSNCRIMKTQKTVHILLNCRLRYVRPAHFTINSAILCVLFFCLHQPHANETYQRYGSLLSGRKSSQVNEFYGSRLAGSNTRGKKELHGER